MRSFILSYRGKSTVVISSHQLDDIQKLCTHVAFVDAGKVERIVSLSSITSESGRVVYTLRRAPSDMPALEALMEGLSLAWSERDSALTAEFDSSVAPDVLNSLLLPRLIPCGIVSVVSGRTLEQAYLRR